MKRSIIFWMLVLILTSIALAAERYYSLELNYLDGIISFRNINLLSGTAPAFDSGDDYILRVISFYNTILYEKTFGVNENKDFTLYIPYYKEGEEIVIFKDREKILGYNIASFADVCGDGTCQFQESYESCPEDCPSGLKDDFCDIVGDNKCDSDCSSGLDPDCEEEIIVEKEAEEKKEIIEEEIIVSEEEQIKEGGSLLHYIIFSLLILVILIFAIVILSRYKANKQNEAKMECYIQDNLRGGYTQEQIKRVLLNSGYKEKDIDKSFRKFPSQ